MVICNLDVSRTSSQSYYPMPSKIMGDPPAPSKKGFRLMEAHQRQLQDNSETGSIYSVYKQKIDSMFESDSSHGADKSDGNYRSSSKNSVQARIEKMFVEVANDEGLAPGGSELGVGVHGFSVDYLGSVELVDKVTNLAGLQEPLKKLYFQYKNDKSPRRLEQKPLSERLEISAMGLKVQYRSDKGDIEQLNPFPTIAVWSAVKFVLHHADPPNTSTCAFLPLITDPDNLDKQGLFCQLNASEIATFQAQGTQKPDSHAPLFAVVMRSNAFGSAQLNVPSQVQQKRRLECHGFACQTSEDAIVIAATLYKSLMAHMSKARQGRKPKTTREGISCISTTSSVLDWNGDVATPVRPPRKKRSTATSSVASASSDREQPVDIDDSRPLLTANKSSLYAKKSSKTRRAPTVPLPKPEDLDAITPYEEVHDSFNTAKTEKHSYVNTAVGGGDENASNKHSNNAQHNDMSRSVSRNQNLRKNAEGDNQGDILTKVTIPRSGSFLNAGGLTKYKSKLNRANGQASGGSPLGFHELFNEFRLQEGLHSIDEILGVIIDPEGMSFNDLKPIYKEFLLKLALTLTKDELFQRSKAIMKKQKKKSFRTKSPLYRQKKASIVSSKLKSIQHIFSKKIKAKLKTKFKKKDMQKAANKLRMSKRLNEKIPESSISTSSYDTRQFRPKEHSISVMRRPSYKKKHSNGGIRNYKDLGMSELKSWQQSKERISTSEESDFFSLQRARGRIPSNPTGTGSNPNRNSSSGYVSCSECSYDSDTCTCASADKCYCSLGNRNQSEKHHRVPSYRNCKRCHLTKLNDKCYCSWKPMEGNMSLTYCECDTDSCSDSNKCYCKKGERRKNTRHGNSTSVEPKYQDVHRNLCKKVSNSKSTRSLEYVHEPSEQYYEKLRSKIVKHYENDVLPSRRRSYDNMAFDMDVWTGKNAMNSPNYRRNKAMSECGNTSSFCKAPSIRSFQSATKYVTSKQTGKTVCSTSVSTGGCTEALSVKKSAEIAALFADIKLSQTTDITHLIPPKDYDIDSGRRSNSNRSSSYTPRDRGYFKSDKRKSDRLNSIPPPIPIGPRVMNNPVYVPQKSEKSKLYSTRNGLYTIPSQSDESRRSSFSESRNKDKKSVDEQRYGSSRNVSNNLENSLGYLP
ncbi:uncharacterized protein LOC108733900 [Agrilus planipennis]|uniref:Uncharacterized protein LOC108733900 n=1 Tax=Agrilus planipennis TaxID=224129 RepID=A0A7F5RI02_AGRPL|nr:uncharacterized protein LOC108733900 [Agrilus planipennis]